MNIDSFILASAKYSNLYLTTTNAFGSEAPVGKDQFQIVSDKAKMDPALYQRPFLRVVQAVYQYGRKSICFRWKLEGTWLCYRESFLTNTRGFNFLSVLLVTLYVCIFLL